MQMENFIFEINEAFKSCFSKNQTLLSAETTNDIDAEVQESIKNRIPHLLNDYLSDSTYKVKGSVGAGRATKTPWIAILDRNITETTREGVYIVFLFSSDCKNVYITLNQGTTQPNQFGPRLGIKEVTRKAQDIRALLNINKSVLQIDGKADIYDDKYKAGAIYYTLWDVNDENKCKQLIDLYLHIYKQYKTMTASPQKSKSENISPKYLPYLTALRTKPFMLLAGISGTGKSRIVREMAFKSCPSYLQDEDGTTPGNYCMIEVKPNWHDSSELLGYYSSIAKQYIYTDFVKFLVKAMMFPEVPFFVCLDEMNLAPVEQYFAEFLSVLETRKKTESGIKTGALVKAKYFEDLPDADRGDGYIYTQWFPDIKQNVPYNIYTNPTLKTKGLGLPENVFVIGTVNMDDTTHQFSRKVLDRAMTIEMNGGKLTDMFGHSNDLEYLPEENVWKIDQFKPKYVNADEVLDEHTTDEEMLKTQLSEKLGAINDVLEGTPFVVSYRVLNELVIYAGVLLDDGKGMDEVINDAVDQITLMKILPRIEGDEDMLGNAKDENNRLYRLMKVVGPQSQAKLKEMNRRLESGFTRFWP